MMFYWILYFLLLNNIIPYSVLVGIFILYSRSEILLILLILNKIF